MVSRRDRYRSETRQEVKTIAGEQLAEAGPAGISVNAIAKRMGVTGPALYRYFASRDELLTELIGDAFDDLAESVEGAIDPGKPPVRQFRDMAAAFREWAIAAPHRYLLLFGTPVPGYEAPAHTIDAASRTLNAFATVLVGIPLPVTPAAWALLEEQVAKLAVAREISVPPAAMLRAVQAWTRLHGVVSLEVEGQFGPTGVDPGLLFQAEVDALIGE